ncbi:MAG: hypothetical protein Q4A16_03920 [Lautropia sp.]|nr:hypothetical protein [Lautropia sp.]
MLDSIPLPSWLNTLLAQIMGWLQQPIRTGYTDPLNEVDCWHGMLMGAGGGVMIPVAVLAARYWKIVPGQDWPRVLNHMAWQRIHAVCGYGAILFLLVGAYLAFQGMSLHVHLRHTHSWAGWSVVLLLVPFIINIVLRGSIGGPGHRKPGQLVHLHDVPGDHYDMTFKRRFFERVHRWLGFGLVVALCFTILTGFWHINVPRWLLLCTGLWWVLLLVMAWRWERQGRAVDGYQARWGPSMAHPGNRIPLLSWGLRRYTEAEYRRLPWGGRLARRRRRLNLLRQKRRRQSVESGHGRSTCTTQ